MRRLLGVLLICALTPLAAGCGAGDEVKSAVDPVAQAATKTRSAGSVEVAMSGKASAAGQEIPLQGEGVFDLKAQRGRFTMTTSVPGQDGVKIEEIVDGLVLYMHSDALTKGLPGGKRWLKIDLKAAAGKQGVDITQLQSLSGGGDPTQFLTYLAKAGDVRKVGSEDVNGTPTTHYHATIDFEKLAGVGRLGRRLGAPARAGQRPEEAADRHLDRCRPARAPPDGGHRRQAAAAHQVLAADRLQALRGTGRREGSARRRDRRLQRRRGRRLSAGAPRSDRRGPC
jgi:hypothetical protein